MLPRSTTASLHGVNTVACGAQQSRHREFKAPQQYSRSLGSKASKNYRCTTKAVLQPLQLATIAAEPVVKVALLSGAGALCAKQGILSLQGRRLLSGLIMNIFTPALLLSKLGSSVHIALAISLWPLAANMLICHAVGLAIGWLQVKLVSIPKELQSQTLVMNTAGNIGNLPLVLVPSLIASPDVFISSEGKEMAITYVMLGFFVASFIQFPCGYLLLQRPPQQQQHLADQHLQSSSQLTSAAVTSATSAQTAAATQSTPSAQLTAVQVLPQQHPQTQQQQHVPKQQQQQQPSQLLTLAKGVFTPPVIACLLAIPVATIPALKEQLFTPTGGLHSLGDSINMLGQPLIPCLFLVLGANLAEGPGAAQVPPMYLISMIASKLVLHPLAGMALVLGSLHMGLVPSSTDPLVPLVMMMVWATPTAVLVHSLATMLQNGEDQVSCYLFWQYLACLFTLPAFMAVYLQLLQSGQLAAQAGLS